MFRRNMLLPSSGHKTEAVGSSKTGIYILVYTALLPKRPQQESSETWKPQMLQLYDFTALNT
jgi:hypothetical protein